MVLGGKSVLPDTKPIPQSHWCPFGLTHTHKRRVQRLRTLEIEEEKKLRIEIEEKKLKSMMHVKMLWRPKQVKMLTSDDEDCSLVDAASLSE